MMDIETKKTNEEKRTRNNKNIYQDKREENTNVRDNECMTINSDKIKTTQELNEENMLNMEIQNMDKDEETKNNNKDKKQYKEEDNIKQSNNDSVKTTSNGEEIISIEEKEKTENRK